VDDIKRKILNGNSSILCVNDKFISDIIFISTKLSSERNKNNKTGFKNIDLKMVVLQSDDH
jgi:hypothetical protein